MLPMLNWYRRRDSERKRKKRETRETYDVPGAIVLFLTNLFERKKTVRIDFSFF